MNYTVNRTAAYDAGKKAGPGVSIWKSGVGNGTYTGASSTATYYFIVTSAYATADRNPGDNGSHTGQSATIYPSCSHSGTTVIISGCSGGGGDNDAHVGTLRVTGNIIKIGS